MYVCIYIYIYIHIHVCVCVYIYIYIYIYTFEPAKTTPKQPLIYFRGGVESPGRKR